MVCSGASAIPPDGDRAVGTRLRAAEGFYPPRARGLDTPDLPRYSHPPRLARNNKAIALVAASGRSTKTGRGWRIEVRPQAAAIGKSCTVRIALKHLLLARARG